MKISPKLLEKWRAEWRARGEAAFPGAGRRPRLEIFSNEQQRIAELERKIGQMAMENDFLKRALQHFNGCAAPSPRDPAQAAPASGNSRPD